MILEFSLALAALAQTPASEEGVDEGAGTVQEEQLEQLLEEQDGPRGSGSHRFAEEDFAPYFEEGALKRAKKAFDAKQYARARWLFAGDALPVRYMRALSALYAQQDRVAAFEMGVLSGEYPALRDHCLFHAARAFERLRKAHAAAAVYDAVAPESSLYPDARFALARVLKGQLELEGAVAALQPLRDLPALPRHDAVRRRALVAVIALDQARGDYKDEHKASLELWATSPTSREATAVLDRLQQLPIPNKWRLRRAESFLALHEHEEATKLALQVKTVPPDEDACRAGFIVGNALRKDRRHRAAISALRPIVAQCPRSEVRPQALYVMAYSQSVVDVPNGIKTYEALARDYPDHAFADDALFFAAELYAASGQPAVAMERLEQVATRYPQGNFVGEAIFRLAWLQWGRGALDGALATLDRLSKLPGIEQDGQLRARYWKARILEAKGGKPLPELYAALAREHPASWYGLLARTRTPAEGLAEKSPCGEPGAPCPTPSVWPLEAGPLAEDPKFLAGVELFRMGLPEGAEELMEVERRGLPSEAARLLMEVLDLAGKERSAALVARAALGEHLRGGVDERSQKVWEAMYPLPFRRLVEKHAQKARVSADLVQALMREESRFRPWARSSTGAIGLTQVMPATARRVAHALKLKGLREASLFRPQLNILLGATYLGSLISELGSVPHAVAAYNAGPQAVRRWVRARPDAQLDTWVEEIPFTETRGYVKRVLASYAAYQLVYGAAASPLTCGAAPPAPDKPPGAADVSACGALVTKLPR